MSVFDHWQMQKEPLRRAIEEQHELADVVYQIRHALLQTEQNALAELSDDVLRQQAGVLMSCVKTSVGLLDARVSSQVWVPQRAKAQAKPKGRLALWTIAALLEILLGGYCYFKGLVIGWIVALAVLVVGICALAAGRKGAKSADTQDEVRVTLKPDIDRLFSLLDGQIRAVDRSLNDLAYLNDQLRGGAECTDAATLSRVANLLEALYECDESVREPACEAADRMLESMGLCALPYSEENRRLFSALPSKTETRTLSPAILSTQDNRLLRRGTAAVRIDAA